MDRAAVTPKKLAAVEKEHEDLTTTLAAARSEVDVITQELGQVAGDKAAFGKLDGKRVEAAREVERLELRAGQLEAEIEEARRLVEAAEHSLAVERAQTHVRQQEQACESAARAFRRALKGLVAAGGELKRHRALKSEAVADAQKLGFEPESTDEFDWLADFPGPGKPLVDESKGVLMPGPRDRYNLEEVEALLALRPDRSRSKDVEAHRRHAANRDARIGGAVERRLRGLPPAPLSADEAAEADQRYWKHLHAHLERSSPQKRAEILRNMRKAGRAEYAAKIGADAFTYESSDELSREELERLQREGARI